MFKVTICDLKNKDRNMADNIEHQDKGELVANCDRFNSLKHSTVRSYAFTEQGVAMLSTVLRSETAIRVSIRIMDAFVAMRRFMVTNAEVFQCLSTMEYHQLEMQQHLQETDKRIESVTESFLAIIHNNNNIVSPLYNINNSNEKDINGHCGYFSRN